MPGVKPSPEEEFLSLLEQDIAEPQNDVRQPALWRELLAGEAPADWLRPLAAGLFPLVGGTGRNALFSKVSNLEMEHARIIFQQLYEGLKDPARDPEKQWRRFAYSVGCTDEELDRALHAPTLEVAGFVDQARWFGHRSAHEAAGVAYMIETQLPTLWGTVGDAFRKHYRVPEEGVGFFRMEREQGQARRPFLHQLVNAYCENGTKRYEARRAAREVAWCWHAMSEQVHARLLDLES
jgi:hypothetical protein